MFYDYTLSLSQISEANNNSEIQTIRVTFMYPYQLMISNFSSGKNRVSIQTRNPIITKENILSVIIRKGKVTKLSIGFIKNNNNPSINPTTKIVVICPS